MAAGDNRKSHNSMNQNSISIGVAVSLFLIGLFMLLAPFQMGFFNGTGLHGFNQFMFEEKVMYGSIFGITGLIVYAFHLIRIGTIEQRHLLACAGALLPLIYWVSSWNADSSYLSRISLLLNLTFYAFFLMGILLANNNKALHYLKQTFIYTGYVILLYGFMILFGIVYVTDGLSFDIGVRLASVFTYSNANAVYLLLLLVAVLLRLTAPIKKMEFYVHVFMLVPIVSSMVMTLSRSGMIMLPVIGLVILFMVGIQRQVALLGYLVGSILLSFVLLSDLSKRGTDTYHAIQSAIAAEQPFDTNSLFSVVALGGWLRLAAAGLVMIGIVFVAQKYIIPIVSKKPSPLFGGKRARVYIPSAMVLISIVGFVILKVGLLSSVLPEGISGRIDNFSLETHSVIERTTLYKDAIQLWKKKPLLGGGGGSWEARYEQFQTYPYLNAQTHSYPIQILVEIGIIGLLTLAAFILYIVMRYLRNYFRQEETEQEATLFYFLIAASILIHSLIDFEMNYTYMGAMVFLGLGVLAGRQTRKVKRLESPRLAISLRRSIGGLLLIVTIFNVYIVIEKLTIFGFYKDSVKLAAQQEPLGNIVQLLDTGLSRDPDHPFLLDRIIGYNLQAYDQSKQVQYLLEAKQYLEKLKTSEPNYKSLAIREYVIASTEGRREESLRILEQAIPRYPYELAYYEQVIVDRLSLWQEYRNGNKVDSEKIQEEAILAMVAKVQERVKHLDTLSDVTVYIRKFEMTTNMYYAAGLMHFYGGRYQEAVNMMQPGIPESLDTEVNKNIALYYLASLRKLGQDNIELYEKLIAADPEMVNRVADLALEKK